MNPATTFIYALNDPETGECRYIGKADNPRKRFTAHLWSAGRKRSHLGCWITGLQSRNLSPVLEVLIEVPYSEWEFWEKEYIRIWRDVWHDKLTNLDSGGKDGKTGSTPSPETRMKRRMAMLGKKHSPEARAKMRAARLGRTVSPETRAKLRAVNLGKKHSPEHCAKIGMSHLGKKRSPEACAKISASQLGKEIPPESCARMSAAHLGKKLSAWHRERISTGKLGEKNHWWGKKHSPESRSKMSASRKLWLAKQKVSP